MKIDMAELTAETFTARCRRLLSEQPNQLEFAVSRAGLETLVLDSERYAEQNAKLLNDEHNEKWRYKHLDEQIADLKQRWPEASLGDEPDQYGQRLLSIPGVRRNGKLWQNDVATIYLLIPNNYPNPQPSRFFTSDADTLLKHGGQTDMVIRAHGNPLVEGLWEWLWRVREPSARHTLLQHVAVAQGRFQFTDSREAA